MSHVSNARIVTALAVVLCVTAVLRGRAATTTAAAPTRVTADCCASGDQNAPAEHTSTPEPAADQPTADSTAGTEPVSISGSVSIAKRLDLQAPDLSRAVVYIASHAELDAEPTGIDYVTVAQKNKAFIPDFTVIPRGTIVEFPNWDDFYHNVFSRSKAAPAFDLDRYPQGQSKSRVFEKVGVVQVFCNIHPQMRAIIFVTPNRYFTRADADGKFAIRGVPPGQYEVVAWHDRCAEQRQTIEVRADSAAQLAFTLEENRQSIIANDPPRRDPGYGVERGLGVKREKLNLPVVKDHHPAPDAPPQ